MSKKIVELALENAKLNNEIANSVTGGDSYCHLMVSVSSNSIAEFVVLTRGKYPVYDVEIQIHDLEEKTRLLMERVEKEQISNSFIESMQLMNIASKTKKIGNIHPNVSFPFGTIQLPTNADKKTFDIRIFARNGTVLQSVQFRKVSGQWIWADTVSFNGRFIEKHVPPDFPLDDDSKFIWKE